MIAFFKALVAKITAGWVGYATTAVVATAVTGGSIVLLADSGVINLTSGLGQHIELPFTFKPAALGSLDTIYGSLTAGASAALTGAGVQLPPIALSNKIAAVSNKIVAEAAADKTALQRLSEAVQKAEGFKASQDTNQVLQVSAGTPTPTPLGILTAQPTGTSVPTATFTPVRTATRTETATATATGTITITPTPTASGTATPTSTITLTPTATGSVTITPTDTPTPTPTNTPYVVFSPGGGQMLITMQKMIPGGPGVSAPFTVTNVGAHPFNYGLTTSCATTCNILWTDPANGLQMAVDRGTTRDPNNPRQIPPGNSNIYTGPIQVNSIPILNGVRSNQQQSLSVTVWLPLNASTTGQNALTPNPSNNFQGLSLTVNFTWSASEA